MLRKTQKKFRHLISLTLILFLLLGSTLQAVAATITVNTLNDNNSAGNCELREAITSANTNAGVDSCTAGAASPTVDLIDFSTGAGTITLNGTQLPTITETVNIDGDIDNDNIPDITIDAGGTSRVLDINSPDVTVQGFNFLNGAQAGQNGGTIRVRSAADLTLLNSVIDESPLIGTANATNGGAISIEAGADDVSLTNVNIGNTSATASGGAVYIGTNADTVIMDDVHIDGTAAANGGGIFVNTETVQGSPEDLELQITNSTIQNTTAAANPALAQGGAINLNSNVEASLDNVTIDSAQADNHGGAIYIAAETSPPATESYNLILTDTFFSNATADIDGGGYNGGCIYTGVIAEVISNNDLNLDTCQAFWGGGIYIAPFSSMTLNGSADIINNSAERGGGIYMEGGAEFISDGVGPLNFSNNAAATTGGAIHIEPTTASDIIIDNADFISNSSLESGGAIFIDNENTLTISNSNFYNNLAYQGGAIHTRGGPDISQSVNLNIDNSNFEGNTVSGVGSTGGAIYAGVRTIMDFDNITTDVPVLGPASNSAELGGFLFMANLGDNSALTLDNSDISNNTALNCGAMALSSAYNPPSPPIQLTNVTMSSNSATSGYGGAICQASSLLLDNVDFTNNSADTFGGAIHIDSSTFDVSTEIVNGSDFTDNFVNNFAGGAIYIIEGLGHAGLSIANSNFFAAFAAPFAAGGIIYNDGALVDITDSAFTSNDAAWVTDGGAIYNSSGTLTLNNSSISHFAVTGSGGAFYNDKGVNIITNSSISNNDAGNFGGGIYSTSSGIVSIDQSYIGQNSADDGGGVYINENAFDIVNSTVENNNAAGGAGGGIYLGPLALGINIISTTIANNNAADFGGGLFVSAAVPVDLAGTIIADNSAGANGPDCDNSGTFSASGYNLISDSSGCGGVFQPTDIIDVPADLGLLGLHGGATLNYILLPSSPAINNGGIGQTVDQRGVARPQGVNEDIGSHEYEDRTSPIIAEVTPVVTPTTDTTPDYTFSSNEAGTITYGGGCSSATTSATVGNVTITFNTLAPGTYSLCTITVTDILGNISNLLNISTFTIEAIVPPSSGGGSGGSAGFGQPACSGSACSGAPSTEPEPTTPTEPTTPAEPTTPSEPVIPPADIGGPEPTAPTGPTQPSSTPEPLLPPSTDTITDESATTENPSTDGQPPSTAVDLSTIPNLIQPPQNYQQFVLGESAQICNSEIFSAKFNLSSGPIWQDSDGDGLSDAIECQISTDPTKPDTDNDGKTDSDEALNLFTNPTKADQFSTLNVGDFVIVTLPEDSLITADDSPLFLGLARPERFVDVYLFDSADFDGFREKLLVSVNQMDALSKEEKQRLYEEKFNNLVALILQKFINQSLDPNNPEEAQFMDKIKFVGRPMTDQNGIFILDSRISLRDNRYLVMGTSNNTFSKPVEFTLDSSLALITPEAKTLDNQEITPEILSGQAILEISPGSNKPVLTGKVSVPSRVVALWQSNITGSALIADTLDQEFRLTPPKPLEPGEHTVYLTAYRNTDNAQSKTQKITFRLNPPTKVTSLPWWPFAIASLLALILMGLMIKRREKKAVTEAMTAAPAPKQPSSPTPVSTIPTASTAINSATTATTGSDQVPEAPRHYHHDLPPIHQGPIEGTPDDPVITPPHP